MRKLTQEQVYRKATKRVKKLTTKRKVTGKQALRKVTKCFKKMMTPPKRKGWGRSNIDTKAPGLLSSARPIWRDNCAGLDTVKASGFR